MVATNTTTQPRRWLRDPPNLAFAFLLPLLVVSQWLTLTVAPSARVAFNLAVIALAFALLVLGRREVAGRMLLWASTAGVVAVLLLSLILNRVGEAAVVVFGSLPYVFPLIIGLAAFSWRPQPEAVSVATKVVAATLGLIAAAALLQLAFGEVGFRVTGQVLEYPRWWERGRATGLVVNPARLAHIGLLGIAVAISSRRFFWPLAAAGGIAAAASGGRVVILSSAALLLLWVVTRNWDGSRRLVIAVGLTVSAFVAFQLMVPNARDDLLGRIDDTVGAGETDVRIENLEASWALIQDKPLLGAGPGRFGSTTAYATKSELHDEYGLLDVRSPEYQEEVRRAGDDREIDVGTAQLDIGALQIATELGLLGLVATGIFAFTLVRSSFRGRSLASISILALLAIFSLTGPGWVDASLAGVMLFWAGALRNPNVP